MIKFPIKRLALLLMAPLLVMCLPAASQPNSSPSAVAAARLKNKPPKNWIRHYLGDDRYKIAGGVWKVVSTELDHYYYPAWAPEMLRQKPGIVIGFASAAEAEEAGYRSAGYPVNLSLYGLTQAEILAAKKRALQVRNIQGVRVLLADGVSSVILPPGWKVLESKKNSVPSAVKKESTSDLLAFGNSDSVGMLIMTIQMPDGVDVSREYTVEGARENIAQTAKQLGNSPLAANLRGTKISAYSLGGLPGIIKREAGGAGLSSTIAIIAARGQKIYWFQMAASTEKAPGFSAIVNSFQPR